MKRAILVSCLCLVLTGCGAQEALDKLGEISQDASSALDFISDKTSKVENGTFSIGDVAEIVGSAQGALDEIQTGIDDFSNSGSSSSLQDILINDPVINQSKTLEKSTTKKAKVYWDRVNNAKKYLVYGCYKENGEYKKIMSTTDTQAVFTEFNDKKINLSKKPLFVKVITVYKDGVKSNGNNVIKLEV